MAVYAKSSSGSPTLVEIKLNDNTLRSFKTTKVFNDNADKINSFDFSAAGNHIISCTERDQIVIYDCRDGCLSKTINSLKYGVGLVRFTHNRGTAIHSSTKVDDSVRYLSLHDNKFISYLSGHTNKVVSLCVSAVENTIASGSLDKSIRFWDLRSANCQGLISVKGNPMAAFDPDGLVLAAGVNSDTLMLYDLRSFDKGPFLTVKIQQNKEYCDWTDIKFSPDGRNILISTNGSLIRLVDAFNGSPIHTFDDQLNNKCIPIEASFSPDSQYVFSGSTDGLVHVWNVKFGYKVCALNSIHPGPVNCVKFNPKFMMMASTCTDMAFWLPTMYTTDLAKNIL